MAWESVSNYYSGQGVVLIGQRDTTSNPAKPAGLIEVGNCSDVKVMINTSTVEHKETTTGARAIDLRLTTEVKANMTVTIENFNSANLAIALRGNTVKNAVAGTVTAEALTVYLGYIVPLQHLRVSTVVVKKGATALVEGTDYSVNLEAGSIKWLAGGTLVDGDACTVAYSFAPQNEVHALTQPAQSVWVRFEGLNSADGNKPVVVDVYKLSTDPLKELDLIGDKVTSFQLEGTILADLSQTTGTSRYFRTKMLF